MNHEPQDRTSVTNKKALACRVDVGFAVAGRRFEAEDWGLTSFHASETHAISEMDGSSDKRHLAVIPAEVEFAANGNVRIWKCLGEPIERREPAQSDALLHPWSPSP